MTLSVKGMALVIMTGVVLAACAGGTSAPLGLSSGVLATDMGEGAASRDPGDVTPTPASLDNAGATAVEESSPDASSASDPPPQAQCEPRPQADCSGLDLRGRSFNRADLSGVNFSHTNLEGASFVGARLTEADFSDANLARSDFRGAVLARANLQGASVRQANFRGASLVRANLLGIRHFVAVPLGEEWWGVDFSDAIWPDGRRCRPSARGYCYLSPRPS
ncbi:MAG: pentapeptide repeat-containing protein [Candidatus Nanopelagicales bacterium]|nr:pentapeptide repeat-containing protein [Candidatus Nanopelagicales bacterium]